MRNTSPASSAQAAHAAGQRAHARRKSSTTTAASDQPKKFACGFDGCGRAFTRSEHLQRHLLNHTAGESTCERCRAHFKRKDLLERHMQRHRQKDEEAGAEGAGVLNTRKRMWKDQDGNIVTKRPNLGKNRSAAPSSAQHGRSLSTSTTASIEDAVRVLGGDAPISPPISSTHSSQSDDYGRRSSDACDATTDPTTVEAWVFPPLELSPGPEPHAYPELEPLAHETERFWSNASGLQTSSLRNLSDDVPYDDIFNPDTASSFNMPFTTMNNYNWLFDVDLGAPAAQHFSTSTPDILSGTFTATHVDQAAPDPQPSTHTFPTGVPPEHTPAVSELALIPTDEHSIAAPTAPSAALSHAQSNSSMLPDMSLPESTSLSLPSLEPQHSAFADEQRSVTAASTIGRSQTMNIPTPLSMPIEERARVARESLATRQAQIGIDFERPMSSMNRSASLPVIDEVARAQVLDVIEAARPITPDGLYISRSHPLLSLSSLQTYCDLYFTRFNTAYPLIHQPTFDASHVETLLLVSVLLLGATYCEKDAHQMAVCIHDVLRPQIFAHAGFNAKPDLWVLQTILLVECFGKSRAGQKQHDMAHLFHGLLINLIRRSDCQAIRTLFTDECSGDLDNDWRKWAEAEQKKRLAYLCFLWDVQHAVLFCQSLCMSAFELRSNLPCNQQLWEADSAEVWQRLRKQQKSPPLFLALVKAYLTPGGPPIPRNLNALSRLLLLHGLMSISWDMKRRDQTSLGLVGCGNGGRHQSSSSGSPIGDWKTRMSTSYNTWKADFDAYCANYLDLFCSTGAGAGAGPAAAAESHHHDSSSSSNSNSNSNSSGGNSSSGISGSNGISPPASASASTSTSSTTSLLRQEFITWSTANAAVYHAAHVLLNAEFLDLQIYAGARHILGRPVGRADYVRSQRVVKRWAGAGAGAGADHQGRTTSTSTGTSRGGGTAGGDHQSNNNPGQVVDVERLRAARAARHAALLIREGVERLDAFDAGGLFHYPWCLYLATLTCWAWWHARPAQPPLVVPPTDHHQVQQQKQRKQQRRRVRQEREALMEYHPGDAEDGFDADDVANADADVPEDEDENEDEMVWDAAAELDALVGCMTASPPATLSSSSSGTTTTTTTTTAQEYEEDDDDDSFGPERRLEAVARGLRPAAVRRRTTGLTAVVARHLSKVRWAVVHDGMMVLKGLVPWRMIGGAEGGLA
ncbi:c2h2 finger domain transcription factor [Diplodia corticola]|uniref:C2h2 finger domain transcription factor n=1 Tax=Diplodia corticola TaxID=236234 RepID=A0A1J9R9H3_9PEZI|nr:c2h2 finger domain transcription factor [Diplodia corticola]OJD29075.1 c2h2 finger domain transcription factor [Diplodia corticola]